jgi:pyridoxamine 5'-phosphate oxidase
MRNTLAHSDASRVLRREDLHDDPLEQFTFWLKQAAIGPVPQPLALSLATAGADGRPLVRTVLLKYYDEEGFVFFTHLGSRKVRQMAENAQVSMLFPWLALSRQVIIAGRAERLGALDAVKCFLLGENNGVTAKAAVAMQLDEIKRRLAGGTQPFAASWGGFRIKPDSFEFWQGRGERDHDRFLYSRCPESEWKIDALE